MYFMSEINVLYSSRRLLVLNVWISFSMLKYFIFTHFYVLNLGFFKLHLHCLWEGRMRRSVWYYGKVCTLALVNSCWFENPPPSRFDHPSKVKWHIASLLYISTHVWSDVFVLLMFMNCTNQSPVIKNCDNAFCQSR